MRIENAIAPEVLERILSAYGFKMQKELAEKLGIASSNVGSWMQRGHVPGNVIVQCALDTGADVNWIVTGKLANASLEVPPSVGRGKALYDEIMSNGGKPALRRIMDAYGFTQQKQLCDLFKISSGTVSTWVRRDYFPGDVVVACALDTGVSLQWLATGKGNAKAVSMLNNYSIPKFKLDAGLLTEVGLWSVDKEFLDSKKIEAIYIEGLQHSWIVDLSQKKLGNGRWVVEIEDSYEIYDIVILPGGKLKLANDKIRIECSKDDLNILGVVIYSIEKHY